MSDIGPIVTTRERDGVRWIDFVRLGDPDRLVAAVSTRHGGVSDGGLQALNLSYSVRDSDDRVRENRSRLFRALSVDPDTVSYVRQVHGCRVVEGRPGVGGTESAVEPVDADAQMTDQLDVALFLTFADCVPILVHDPVRRAVGLGHAGWRGTIAGVGSSLVNAMVERYGCRASDLMAGIGPAIGPCCYEVGADVAAQFRGRWGESDVVHDEDGRQRADLWLANRLDLIDVGVPERNIYSSRICTSCNVDDYFSHRQQHGAAGRFAAVVRLR